MCSSEQGALGEDGAEPCRHTPCFKLLVCAAQSKPHMQGTHLTSPVPSRSAMEVTIAFWSMVPGWPGDAQSVTSRYCCVSGRAARACSVKGTGCMFARCITPQNDRESE
eukprot:1159282-Pelagomonas_calceolata.AAC.13